MANQQTSKPATVRVNWMYPNVLNLHGDRGNVLALQRFCEQAGIELQLRRLDNFEDNLHLDETDLMIFNPGELAAMPRLNQVLAQRRSELVDFVARGGGIFCTGTTGSVFGQGLRRLDGSGYDGLGLLAVAAVERAEIYGDDLIFRVTGLPDLVVAFQVRMVDWVVDWPTGQGSRASVDFRQGLGPLQPFGSEIIYGLGNGVAKSTINGSGGASSAGRAVTVQSNLLTDSAGQSGSEQISLTKPTEGFIRNNLIATNALGPVLVKNPWLTQWLLTRIFASLVEQATAGGSDAKKHRAEAVLERLNVFAERLAKTETETDVKTEARFKSETEVGGSGLWGLEKQSAASVSQFVSQKEPAKILTV